MLWDFFRDFKYQEQCEGLIVVYVDVLVQGCNFVLCFIFVMCVIVTAIKNWNWIEIELILFITLMVFMPMSVPAGESTSTECGVN